MARREFTANFNNTNIGGRPTEDARKSCSPETSSTQSDNKGANKMPLTQEKHLDSNFSNNNDHNYRHKKFKKMASAMSIPETSQSNEMKDVESHVAKSDTDTSISNGSIAASHPEIEKIKENKNHVSLDIDKNVQTTFKDNGIRLSDINNKIDNTSGITSSSEEFLNKTDNLDSDFIRDVQNGTGGRHVCPYCKLQCAKPSVLQKHIRAHTNERPYPCGPCGFAFKTKSNLYKHRRSRSHAMRLQGLDAAPDDLSDDSDGSELDAPDAPDAALAAANDRRLYKPKFRAASFRDGEDKLKIFTPNADFLNEHISKIISDNEAIIDVIDTPLQKKYSKIKQIAESKQLQQNENIEIKSDSSSPLNLTKNVKEEFSFRKRAHSETFTQVDFQKHPLNPEGSIIKDLLLKTKANGLTQVVNEADVVGALYVCPLCQIPYRSADNLEIHRMYYCKGNPSSQKEAKISRHDVFSRSNSINVRLPEVQPNNAYKPALSPRTNKPENLVIVKPECTEVAAPLPSPGPLLGRTRLVDTRETELPRRPDIFKTKPIVSPKRRTDNPGAYSPRLPENISPRPIDAYTHSKIRCLDPLGTPLRTLEDIQQAQMKQSATSLQMFGGEVKIVDHSGTMTTLRIEPSKNQLSPIVIHQELSPSDMSNVSEASIVVGSGLYSGGIVQTPKDMGTPKPQTPRITISTAPSVNKPPHDMSHFQFPPLSAITAYNPLTLPPLSPSALPNGATSIMHGGKMIPHVPGIPGPNTPNIYVDTQNIHGVKVKKNEIKGISADPLKDTKQRSAVTISPQPTIVNSPEYESIRSTWSPHSRIAKKDVGRIITTPIVLHEKKGANVNIPLLKIKTVDEITTMATKTVMSYSTKTSFRLDNTPVKRSADGIPKLPLVKDTYNSSTTNKSVDKVLPLTKSTDSKTTSEQDIRNFNFENLITKAEIYNNQIISSSELKKNNNVQSPGSGSSSSERSETSYFQKKENAKSGSDDRKPKFLRPSTLPLKPGTFTPKRHHGITPNANTMPLVSPETPRPAKAYGQLYLNGNAYTYLGLKCSTKVFYCTINRPQPTYVPNQHFLSMYSNWQLLSELTDPLGLPASTAMSLYDSRHRPQNVTIARSKHESILTHSSQSNRGGKDQILSAAEARKAEEKKLAEGGAIPKKELAGGFESNEEYTYIRGRGRGRYVCSECGIRCKKPSMLKKHIRTHTDVRPYTCIHCAFSFKTKGNLTKHMKSKAHYKKCCELGINPAEGAEGGDATEGGEGGDSAEGGDAAEGAPGSPDSDDDSDSDGDEGNEGETESSDTEVGKSRLPEHEAAHCLLSLGAGSSTPGLLSSARPSTYPYAAPPEPAGGAGAEVGAGEAPDAEARPDAEPMDLSTGCERAADIPTPGEPHVLASLASNTAKLPAPPPAWPPGEPMLHAYLTERALLDTRIKQSQLAAHCAAAAAAPSSAATDDRQKPIYTQAKNVLANPNVKTVLISSSTRIAPEVPKFTKTVEIIPEPKEEIPTVSSTPSNITKSSVSVDLKKTRNPTHSITENVKLVVSEYLKIAKVHNAIESPINQLEKTEINKNIQAVDSDKEETKVSDTDSMNMSSMEHEPIARNVVIGAGGVAFKVSKGKDFESMSPYSPGRLMEDGRRVCDFCNKTFTKPSQLRLHLNIHYIERPYRCSACAVSFRTKGHLQKHERSGSHHNKVSMTSTFGAATSQNPRPFRCSDCNVAFRIHGHLAKHLRSKIHVMRLECLLKLPFGTFTEIERAGVSLTDIDTTDCESSLASLQLLARKLHEKDPTKLEFREPPPPPPLAPSSDDEDALHVDTCDSDRDVDVRTNEHSDIQETRVIFSATDN